jgi:hypothetical protein
MDTAVSLLRASSSASTIVNAPLISALTIVFLVTFHSAYGVGTFTVVRVELPWRVEPIFADQHVPRITRATQYGRYVHPTLFTHLQREGAFLVCSLVPNLSNRK